MDFNMKIDPTAKAAWIAALDSGQFPQAKGKLLANTADGGGYCCLGVFAKVQGCEFSFAEIDGEDDDGDPATIQADECTIQQPLDPVAGTFGDLNVNEMLAQDYADQFGISEAHQGLFTHLNDGGEMKLAPGDPMFELARKLCVSERQSVSIATEDRLFKFNPHTFAEISKIISENF